MATKMAAGARARVVRILDRHLADAFDLRSQVKQEHWNVTGSDFWQLHSLRRGRRAAAERVDEVAERVTALGGYADGAVRMAAAVSALPEFPPAITDSMDYVRAVADRLGAFTNATRRAIGETDRLGDQGTSDLFIEVTRCADRYLAVLEAHLQG